MISVCMATYNGEKYIREQLESILKQIGCNDEIIISDDGSKDTTQQVIESIGDKRIRYVKNTGTHGFTHNFENALRLAQGEYIFLADQDDIWLDNKVDVVMKALQNVDFVTHDCITVDPNMQILSQSRFQEFNVKPGFLRHLMKSRYLGCCMAFNRQVLDASLPFPTNDFLVEHDIWLAAVAFAYFKVSLIDEPLIYYRRHGKNASSGGFNKGYSVRVKIEKRLYRIKKLIDIYPSIKERRKLYVGGAQRENKMGIACVA